MHNVSGTQFSGGYFLADGFFFLYHKVFVLYHKLVLIAHAHTTRLFSIAQPTCCSALGGVQIAIGTQYYPPDCLFPWTRPPFTPNPSSPVSTLLALHTAVLAS